jgi:exonuclease SbcD
MIRILFLADTHLGFDYAFKPRVQRRRRGPDFFRNFKLALEPAYRGEVDLVVHGGDIFYRSRVPARLVDLAFEPLKRVADVGVPVYVVPGNHERSNIPYRILAAHPNIFIFEKPSCFLRRIRNTSICLTGFPFVRHDIRQKFPVILQAIGWQGLKADVHLLCMHQSVDGATMGPKNFMFRGGVDVIDIHDIPSGFAVVLTGHMHRSQVLQKDLKGAAVPTPVLYAGAVERTSFAEKDETKGYMTVDIKSAGRLRWDFHELPTLPMVQLEVNIDGMNKAQLSNWLQDRIKKIPADSIVRIKIQGELGSDLAEVIRAESLRALAPETMNIAVRPAQYSIKK